MALVLPLRPPRKQPPETRHDPKEGRMTHSEILNWPIGWLPNGGRTRTCPHQITHPDPEGPTWAHDCDGCCTVTTQGDT